MGAETTAPPSCPTKAKMNPNFNPLQVKHFMKVHDIKTVEEMVCCIAKTPNLKIAIAHNSVAAQDGDYNNPRVLIIHSDDEEPLGFGPNNVGKINSIFSINSGKDGYHQKDAVEMMVNERGNLSFVDIDFAKGQPHMSGRNPEACMQCHGDAGKVPPHGPRTIFDVEPWPRFVFADDDLSRDIFGVRLCKGRQKIESLLKKKAITAVQSNPRYHCIKDKPLASIASLDAQLTAFNTQRVVKFIRSTPNYHKYKFAILGAGLCGDFLPEKYFPQEVLKKMNKQNNLPHELRQISDKNKLFEYSDKQRIRLNSEANIRDRAKEKLGDEILANKKIELGTDLQDSRHCGEHVFLYKNAPQIKSQAQNLRGENVVYNRYMVHFETKSIVGNRNLRYLFESRGIDTSDWNMQPTGGIDRFTPMIGHTLLEAEAKGSKLKSIEPSFRGSLEANKCLTLQRWSKEAFGVKASDAAHEGSVIEQ